ncbi:MAG: hypothetical protein EXR27_13145 [Betaproteobacteria bacterium]|nr:hypothetical protein [Betaproteobacteria bacterium]
MSSSYAGKPCPKCAHVRAESETAPDWQCPKCAIAYAKLVGAQSHPVSGAAGLRASGGGSGASDLDRTGHPEVFITQKFELAELSGFEARNRYRISDARGNPIGYAAEEGGGGFGFLRRQLFGHWRSFEIHFYDNARRAVLHAVHPFRFHFSRLEIFDSNHRLIGAVQRRFSLLTKRFCVENHRGVPIMEVASPIWKLWTFPFIADGAEVASVNKKWSGILSEAFTDRDNFQVEFHTQDLPNDQRKVILAAAI